MTLPLFTSFGSLIIDDIRYPDGTEQRNILGGAGIYAVYGMRIWFEPPETRKIAYIAQEGFDHPESVTEQLTQLEITLLRKRHANQHTTRGLNIFVGDNDHRDFEYIYPIIRTTALDPPDDWVPSIQAIHLISSPERALELVQQWRERGGTQAAFVWEPVPWSCRPECLEELKVSAQYVDVLSPNHEEAAALLGLSTEQVAADECAERLRNAVGEKTQVVVRAGRQGAYAAGHGWVPAYHEQVTDVTGAGNAFCGGFCVGWTLSGGDPIEACLYGAVSASFTVEQVGLPPIHPFLEKEAKARLVTLRHRMTLINH